MTEKDKIFVSELKKEFDLLKAKMDVVSYLISLYENRKIPDGNNIKRKINNS